MYAALDAIYGKDSIYIILEGDITEEGLEQTWQALFEKYQANPAQRFIMVITSNGGEFIPALNFYAKVLFWKINLVTIAVGAVFSAGAFIYLAGSERLAFDGAVFVLHNPRNHLEHAMLDEKNHARHKADLRSSRINQRRIIQKRLHLDRKSAERLLDAGGQILTQRAQKLGIVHKIIS